MFLSVESTRLSHWNRTYTTKQNFLYSDFPTYFVGAVTGQTHCFPVPPVQTAEDPLDLVCRVTTLVEEVSEAALLDLRAVSEPEEDPPSTSGREMA
jgi:hypothetical protein